MSYPQHSSEMGLHPEMAEMRERLERAASGKAIIIEGLILLAGVYAAISPWVVHFSGAEPNLTVNNLIVGLTVALIGVGLAMVPERMLRMAWLVAPLGVWLLISPWVVTASHGARAGVLWNNCVVGAVTLLLGMAAMGLTIGLANRARR
ncbi:SPW repeat protein [Streptomyces glomeratus]|uniref:SPW repeat protein n=1 Tax=Streptomyces glomeratus TaxID=284452 RepID=A0ABP6LLG3_9ACTN|nr:SPW repeat protein [Streptomyces glomeratus]MCF1510745.1 SPW repeat protein [Streptomyces glomeratus]